MPKVSWLKPKINHLKVLLSGYRAEQRLTFDELGERLGCSGQNVKQQMNRPAGKWRIEQIEKYCSVLGIPVEDALKAAVQK